MTIAVNVQGGTGAGKKRPLIVRAWWHNCPVTSREVELSAYSCPDCGTRRP